MSTLNQIKAIVEWSEKGWTPVRFPNAENIETLTIGGPSFLANGAGKLVMVDNDGSVYHVDPTEVRKTAPMELEDCRPAKAPSLNL